MQKSKFQKQFKYSTNDTVASPESYSLPLLTIKQFLWAGSGKDCQLINTTTNKVCFFSVKLH